MKHFFCYLFAAVVAVGLLPSYSQAQFGGGSPAVHEERLQTLEKKVEEVSRTLQKLVKNPTPPPEADGVAVFALRHIKASTAADLLAPMLRERNFRIGFDERTNQLLVSASAETKQIVANLLPEIDRIADAKPADAKSTRQMDLPTSLMIRIFWLSDGEPHPNAQVANEFLPNSVISALQKVGITDPYIVVQSNSTVSPNEEDDFTEFEVSGLPATVLTDQRLSLSFRGTLIPARGNRFQLSFDSHNTRNMYTHKGDVQFMHESQISGSITAPLAHYLVLGTTNYAQQVGNFSAEAGGMTQRGAMVLQMLEAQTFADEAPKAASSAKY